MHRQEGVKICGKFVSLFEECEFVYKQKRCIELPGLKGKKGSKCAHVGNNNPLPLDIIYTTF